MRKRPEFDTNERALELIKAFEGFEPDWYTCPAGVRTIGYGWTGPLPRRPDGRPTVEPPLTRPEAEALLRHALDRVYEPAIERHVRVPLTANQASALASFVYNVGPEAFLRSTLLRRLNAGDYEGAADEMLRWVKARVGGRLTTLPGLVRRRRAERELFLEPDEGITGDPYDHEAFLAAVREIVGGDGDRERSLMAQKVEARGPLPVPPPAPLPAPGDGDRSRSPTT